ncbi:hypothetical protein OJF2_16420 [Aquisphaera giovannonii]|uniref:Carboxypeptidase regulatory-like domain-containing protein n=1 Tax=Aquisphaera giovannonii TaxID=406548 RepID=A0A5B9VZE6_9BACT|nr:carboxypeptidase-like regulatory domain-containing protein [Aquisphaera giovannonii]QEH33145.1 hypothetical protein OJF2_16420 [Aquisphaera giovannonii]
MRSRETWIGIFTVCALALGAGCSGPEDDLPREPVSGTVSLDGKPLPGGTITFTPAGGGASAGGATIKDGSFSIGREGGLVPGNYAVAIYASDRPEGQERPKQAGGLKEFKVAKELIPAKYNAKSELKAEIKKGGGNALQFALDSK